MRVAALVVIAVFGFLELLVVIIGVVAEPPCLKLLIIHNLCSQVLNER